MTSPLLALPRELRDNIYSRLYQDITFKDNYGYNLRLENSIVFTIKHAPLPALLVVNRQLHKEYMQSINCSAHVASDGLGRAKSSMTVKGFVDIDRCNQTFSRPRASIAADPH